MTHKLTLHPISFSSCLLTAALSALVQDQFTSNALKGVSAAAFTFGLYNLYHENRLKKGFVKSGRSLNQVFSSFWKPAEVAKPEQNNTPHLEENHQSNLKLS